MPTKSKEYLIKVFLIDGPKNAYLKYRKLGRARTDWMTDKVLLDEMIKEGSVKIVDEDRRSITYKYLLIEKAAVSMINSRRVVNIRGYVREVIVSHKTDAGDFVVQDGKRMEVVPEHLFYHDYNGQLVLRDAVDFKRRWPNHPIENIKVPEPIL